MERSDSDRKAGMTASRVAWTILVPFVLALAVTAVTVMVRANVSSAPPAASGAKVEMVRISFSPPTLTVAKGAEVVFANKDVAPHTVSADDRSIDSGLLNPGKSFRLVVSKPFTYHCEVHP